MIDAVRAALARTRLYAHALRTTGLAAPIAPTALARFARDALRVSPGPHVALLLHAAAHPDKEALVEYTEHGVRRLTWAQLDAQINRLAHALVARGATGGARVALMLPNGSEYLLAQHALARIGATAVMIGYRSKPAEIAYILDNAEPIVAIVHASFLPSMRDARARTSARGPVIVVGGPADDADALGWDDALASATDDVPPRTRARSREGGGAIVYTSGTTGKPKGANRSWKDTGLESAADLITQVGMRVDERHLVVCPLYHSAAPAFVALTLALGATVILLNHFEPERALDVIAREHVTSTLMVPTMLIRIANLPPATRTRHDTSSLRWVMSGAAPLSTESARQFMAAFGPILWNFYGATETGFVTLAGPSDHLRRPGTIGRALHGNDIRLLDDAGAEVARGQIGELFAANATMIAGYHRNAEATQSSQKRGMFSVGDLARVDDDGYYYLESRKHDMVISGGVNIYPREIEDVLMTHPAIVDAAVIGVPDAEWGESLRAFVVTRPGAQVTETEVIELCRAQLADFKRPRKVTFLPELPRNPTGKVLKRELRELS